MLQGMQSLYMLGAQEPKIQKLRDKVAAEIDAIIISNIKTDIYHPNIIRSSLGGIFFLQIAIDNSNRTINFPRPKCPANEAAS